MNHLTFCYRCAAADAALTAVIALLATLASQRQLLACIDAFASLRRSGLTAGMGANEKMEDGLGETCIGQRFLPPRADISASNPCPFFHEPRNDHESSSNVWTTDGGIPVGPARPQGSGLGSGSKNGHLPSAVSRSARLSASLTRFVRELGDPSSSRPSARSNLRTSFADDFRLPHSSSSRAHHASAMSTHRFSDRFRSHSGGFAPALTASSSDRRASR